MKMQKSVDPIPTRQEGDERVTIRFTSVVGADTSLLERSIAHYRALGVESFHIVRHVDDGSDDFDLRQSVAVMDNAGLQFSEIVRGPWDEDLNARLIRAQMARHGDDWWVIADLDEFHVYDRNLHAVINHCDQYEFDYVEGALLDRVSEDGSLPVLDISGGTPLWSQFPMAGLLTFHLLLAKPTKITLARGWVQLDYGQHMAWTGRAAPASEIYTQVHHFKWTASAHSSLKRRVEAYSTGEWLLLHKTIITESERFLEHFRTSGGRIDLERPEFAFQRCAMTYSNYSGWKDFHALVQARYGVEDKQRRDRGMVETRK